MNRTEYSERYPRKFARLIAKLLHKSRHEKPKGYFEEVPALAADAKPKPTTNARAASQANKRPKISSSRLTGKREAAKLIKPADMPDKRQRTGDPVTTGCSSELQEVLNQLKPTLPRVCKVTINDQAVLAKLQRIFDDKKLIRVIACKGTERAIPPPKDLHPEEAPYRRAIVESRQDHEVFVEETWEQWIHLFQRQLTRPLKGNHVNITVFAANLETNQETTAAAPSVPVGQSDTPPIPVPDEPSVQPGVPDETNLSPPVTPAEVSPTTEAMPSPGEPMLKINSPEQIDVSSQKHGSRFRALPAEERSLLARLHKNLGHPSSQVLGQVLRQKGYPATMIQALEDYQCSTCQMQKKPKVARPATLKSEIDFGDKVSVDGVSWTNKQGTVFHFYHYLDHGTNYHVATVAPNRTTEHAIDKLNAAWVNWAGPPNEFMADAASEIWTWLAIQTPIGYARDSTASIFSADNNMSIRRAALRRNRPHRGHYEPGEWVMVWRSSETSQRWIGPAKVIQQDGSNVVFCQHLGTLLRAAPEHVRPVSAVEAQLISETSLPTPVGTTAQVSGPVGSTPDMTMPQATAPIMDRISHDRQPSQISQDQPDTEPEIPSSVSPEPGEHLPSVPLDNPSPAIFPAHEVPVDDPNVDDELVCDLLTCMDVDESCHLCHAENLAWRFEIDVDENFQDSLFTAEHIEDVILLATTAKKQRTEVKLSQLTMSEQAEFAKAKDAEISNWLSTGTVCRILRNQLSAEQILRCR
eukprot:s1678_g6.t1